MQSTETTTDKVADIINRVVRPSLQMHNGDIELLEVTADGWVRVKMTGACSTCPGAQQTLTEFVEKALRAECSEMRGVIPVTQVCDELIQSALQILRRNNK